MGLIPRPRTRRKRKDSVAVIPLDLTSNLPSSRSFLFSFRNHSSPHFAERNNENKVILVSPSLRSIKSKKCTQAPPPALLLRLVTFVFFFKK